MTVGVLDPYLIRPSQLGNLELQTFLAGNPNLANYEASALSEDGVATGIVLLLGLFPALVLPLALAGSLAMKKRVPETTGTLRTDNLTFAGMLFGTVVLIGALSFMPAVVLGPIADHLSTGLR